MERIVHEAVFVWTPTRHLRHQPADRVGDRQPAGARRLADRLRARRRGGRRDRRAQPEEGRARAGRVRSVHRARHRRHERGRQASRPGPPVQLGAASNAAKRLSWWTSSTTVDGAGHRGADCGEAIRSPGQGHDCRPAVFLDGHRRLAGQVKRAIDQGARLVPAAATTATSSKRRSSPTSSPTTTPTARSSSGPWPRCIASATRPRRSGWPQQPVGLGSYVVTNDSEQAMRVADQIDAGMVFVTAPGSRPPSCRSVNQALGIRRQLGSLGADEFVNKKVIRVAG